MEGLKEGVKKVLRLMGVLESSAMIKRNVHFSILRMLNKGAKKFEVIPGFTLNVDVGSVGAFTHFKVDPDMREEIESFIFFSKGKTALLDIGALYGIFSLSFLENNENGTAYAVDPSPFCLEMLNRNKKINPNYSFEIFPFAMGRNNGIIKMHFEWHHLVVDPASNETEKNLVREVYSLDNFIKEFSFNPDIIKIDVEGFELNVLRGGLGYLSKNNPLLFLELHGEWLERYGGSIKDLIHLLKNLNYRFYHLNGTLIKQPDVELMKMGYRLLCSKDELSINKLKKADR